MTENIGGGRHVSRCGQCGQSDDHPKHHFGEETRHYDCLSADQKTELIEAVQEEGSGPKFSAKIDACEGGAHAARFLDKIVSGELTQAEGLHAKAQAKIEKESAK